MLRQTQQTTAEGTTGEGGFKAERTGNLQLELTVTDGWRPASLAGARE